MSSFVWSKWGSRKNPMNQDRWRPVKTTPFSHHSRRCSIHYILICPCPPLVVLLLSISTARTFIEFQMYNIFFFNWLFVNSWIFLHSFSLLPSILLTQLTIWNLRNSNHNNHISTQGGTKQWHTKYIYRERDMWWWYLLYCCDDFGLTQ